MANLAHRRDIIITKATDNDLQPSSATVHVLPPGGTVVSVAYSTATVLGVLVNYTDFTVQAGHGFSAQQRFIIGTDETTFGQILTALSANVLRAQGTYSAAAGDLLINLGSDTGSTSPHWDDATIPVYSTSDGSGTALAPSSVTTNTEGEYQYWWDGRACWEVPRSGATVLDIVQNFDEGANLRYSQAWINVKDDLYGATGDGTTNDTSAIQAALDAVPSTGAVVYFPKGTYMVSTAIWVPSYTHVKGDGIDLTTIKRIANTLTSTAAAINTNPIINCGAVVGTAYSNSSPGYSITITDLTIDGNYTNQTYASPGNGAHGFKSGQLIGTDTGGCIDGLTIQRVKVTNLMQDGISLTNCRNILIDSCIIYKTGQCTFTASKNGISLSGGSTDIGNGWCTGAIISNNRISYSGDSTARTAEGIANVTWSNVLITGNDISHVDYGVEQTSTAAGSNYTMRNIAVVGNTIHDLTEATTAGQVGVAGSVTSGRNVYGYVVANNTFYNINNAAIYLGSRIHDVVIANNTILDVNKDGTQTTYNMAIGTFDNDGYVITGNMIDLSTAVAGTVGIVAQSFAAAINNGLISNNRIEGHTGVGIVLSAGDYNNTNALVTDNRVIGGTYPIRTLVYGTGAHSGHRIRNNYATGYSTGYLQDVTSLSGIDITDHPRSTIDGWYQDNVTASQTNVALTRTPARWVAPRAGSITGLVVKSTEARTADTLTVTVFKNTGLSGAAGSTTGFTAVLDGTNTSLKTSYQPPYTDTFAAGDELYAVVTTGGSWTPTTADIRVTIEVEM